MSSDSGPGTAEVQAFARATGQSPSTWERRARPLRAAGLVPTSRPGGRKEKGLYDASAFAMLTLSPAGEPIEAAISASTLAALRYTGTTEFRVNHALDAGKAATFSHELDLGYGHKATLGQFVTKLIERFAQMNADERWKQRMAWREAGATLRLSLEPAFAEMTWTTRDVAGEHHHVDRYEPSPDQHTLPLDRTAALVAALQAPSAPIGRVTTISCDLVFVAADLLAATLAQRGTLLPSDTAIRRPKRKAPVLRQEEPAPKRDRPTPEAPTGTSNTPESKAPHTHTQAFDCVRADHSTPSDRGAYNGPCPADAAAA